MVGDSIEVPKFDPITLTMDAPVDWISFAGAQFLTVGTSTEKAREIEPTCHQTVNMTGRFALDP